MSELRDFVMAGTTPLPGRRPPVPAPPDDAPAVIPPARLVKLMAAIVVAATLAAWLASAAKEKVYGGRVELVFNTEVYDSESEFNRALATQREILRSEAVLGPAAKAGGSTPIELEKALDVAAVGESEVIRVTVGDPSPAKARALAQAVAQAYLRHISTDPVADGGATTSFLQARIVELTATLDRTTARQRELEAARAATAPPTAEEARLREEAADLVRRVGALRERVLAVEARRTSASDVRALAPARVLRDPLEPKPKQAAVGGFLIGSMLAAGTAYLLRLIPARRVEKVDRPDVF